MKKKVVIVHKYITQYRKDFFNLLRTQCRLANIDLELVYGQPGFFDGKKNDSVDISWGHKVKNQIFRIGEKEIYWQPIFKYIKDADLVIVEQASKLLINYFLLFLHALRLKKVAFWGHGKNFQQTSANPISEMVKKIFSTKVHWWFAYNELSAQVVEKLGFPRERITIVQNAIDTRSLREALDNQNPEQLEQIRKQLGITGSHVGLYVGGMYAEKRLDFLLDACKLIRQDIPDFEMIFVGSGSEAYKIQAAAQVHNWVHYVGPKFDLERIPFFALSNLFLITGAVGLSILDCFALGIPVITTNDANHGPEIEYLVNGYNGLIVNDQSLINYAKTVVSFFKDNQLQEKLINGCRESASKYTIENMARNFLSGIQKSLS